MSRTLRDHFGLTAMPFDKEISTADLLDLPCCKEAMGSLRLLVETRGIGLLTGKSGTGKSCLLRKLMDELETSLYKPIYLCHSSVGLTEFYGNLAVELGLEPKGRKATLFRAIKERLINLHRQARTHPILIIDEAHLLANEILADLRLLTNFEVDSSNALTVLLCGQESLARKFDLSILEALANSISVVIQTTGLTKEDTMAYVEERIKCCGGQPGLFTKQALNLIHQASHGVFRTIGTIATNALLKVQTTGGSQVEGEHVQSILQR
jgi:type II secretory pathway predicted ATPase ExeA